MSVPKSDKSDLPPQVVELLRTSPIGYLSVKSEKGDLYTYPLAYLFSGMQLYTMTPVTNAKLRFMRANPGISFLVENRKLTLDAVGVMVQGRAKVFNIAKTIGSILSVGPKMVKYAEKYPNQFTFYARGKYLPDDRKLYKYRLVRIEPTKLLYWVGYDFGRYSPAKGKREGGLEAASDDEKMESFASMMRAADDELAPGEAPSQSPEWTGKLDKAVQDGVISAEEREAIGSFRGFLRQAAAESKIGPEVTKDEKKLLKKWKGS